MAIWHSHDLKAFNTNIYHNLVPWSGDHILTSQIHEELNCITVTEVHVKSCYLGNLIRACYKNLQGVLLYNAIWEVYKFIIL